MSTIGQLRLDDIGHTRVIVQHEGSTVSGVLMGIDLDIDRIDVRTMQGGKVLSPGHVRVGVSVTIGSVTLAGLNRDHACEVIA